MTEDIRHFDEKFAEQSRQHSELKQYILSLAEDVGEIKRGVYGDEKNKVPGLIETDRSQHKRIKSLEDSRKQALWWGGGVVAALEVGWHWIKEKL